MSIEIGSCRKCVLLCFKTVPFSRRKRQKWYFNGQTEGNLQLWECSVLSPLKGPTHCFPAVKELAGKRQPTWLWTFHHKKGTMVQKNNMLWPAFPLHFHNSENVSRTPPSIWGAKRFSDVFAKKLAPLMFTTARGLNFSFHSRTIHLSTPPVRSSSSQLWLLILASRLGLSLLPPPPPLHASGNPHYIPAHPDSHVYQFLAVDFWKTSCISAWKLPFCHHSAGQHGGPLFTFWAFGNTINL